MKNKFILGLLAVFFLGSVSVFAQTPKIGYTNLEYILAQLPEAKQIESQLKEFEKQLQNQLQSKYTEYEQKLDTYRKGQATMAEIVKQDKEQELLSLQNNIREFEEKAQSEMQNKQIALLEPVLNKIQKAIDKVAEENSYTYILSTHTEMGSSAIILYAKNLEDNISDKVLQALGVTPKPAETPSGAPVKK